MKRRSSVRLWFGVPIWIAVSLIGCVGAAGATAASSAPAVQVDVKTAKVGELVHVTGTGWAPVGQTVQIELCGQDALNVSTDCDQADQYDAAIRAGGVFYGAVLTHIPPSPCPCVVLVANQGAFSGVRVPITIVGAASSPIPQQATSSTPVVLSAKVLTHVSVGAWFGAPRAVTLLLNIKNRSTNTYESPALSVNVGRGKHPGDFVVARPLAPLAAGATQTLRIPVTLPAFTFGNYSVRAQVITGEEQVATVARTSSYPWALFLIAALAVQGVLLALRNRARRRLGRAADAEPPVEEPELTGEAEPVEVIDLRLPADEPVQGPTEPVEVVDLRSPSLSQADVWTVTHRMAVPLPERGLTCTVEVLSCPSVRLRRTSILAWADFAVSPWDALHDGKVWTETSPDAALNPLVEGETFSYEGRGLQLSLQANVVGPELTLGENHTVVPVRVQGSASIGNEILPLDIESTLEQTWITESPEETSPMGSEPPVGSLTYAQTAGGDSFYLRFSTDGEPDGWLIRDGRASTIVSAVRRIEEQAGPYPRRMVLELSDNLGRKTTATGTASNGMAFREGDGLILECRTEWDIDGVPGLGEDRSEVDLETWRNATRVVFYAGANANANGDSQMVVGQMPAWPPAEPLKPLWQREPVEDRTGE